MNDKPDKTGQDRDRRSSVRVRSMLPLALKPIEVSEIAAMEARILDLAVIESDGVLHDVADWAERTDEISRETVFLLNEIRAMRQQIAEVQRLVEVQGRGAVEPRWVVINDNGLWVPTVEGDPDWQANQFAEVRLHIPSLHTPEILAVGEVIRVATDGDEPGVAVVFRYVSEAHSKAIMRYALRRERQLARSLRFT